MTTKAPAAAKVGDKQVAKQKRTENRVLDTFARVNTQTGRGKREIAIRSASHCLNYSVFMLRNWSYTYYRHLQVGMPTVRMIPCESSSFSIY